MVVIAAVTDDGKTERVLREAKTLADAFGEELQVVHVIAFDETDLDIGISSRDSKERLDDVAVDQVHELVDGTITEYTAVGLVGEDVRTELLEHAEAVDVRYLVVGRHRRSPVGKALLGSTAQSILLNAKSPVVTVM